MITRPITRPITRSITRGITEGIGGAAVPAYQALLDLNPVLLVPSINDAYAEGRLWQDAAMTTPATAVDDPVGAVEDFSGNSYHLTASGTARPLLKQDGGGNWYLQGDAVDDKMSTAGNLAFGGTQAVTVFVACQKKPAVQMHISTSDNVNIYVGAFCIIDGVDFGGLAKGNAGYTAANITDVSVGALVVKSMVVDFSLASEEMAVFRANGVDIKTGLYTYNANNTGVFVDFPAHIMSSGDGSFRSEAPYYGFAIYPSALSLEDIATVESYMASQSGITL